MYKNILQAGDEKKGKNGWAEKRRDVGGNIEIRLKTKIEVEHAVEVLRFCKYRIFVGEMDAKGAGLARGTKMARSVHLLFHSAQECTHLNLLTRVFLPPHPPGYFSHLSDPSFLIPRATAV